MNSRKTTEGLFLMWVLIGIKNAHYPEEDSTEEQLALFTSEKAAQDYEQKSRLSTYRDWCGRGQHGKQYRNKSLLSWYCKAYIESYELPQPLSIDPILKTNSRGKVI